jgi:hypothetical protein
MTTPISQPQTSSQEALAPMAVGRFTRRDGSQCLLPFSHAEFERASAAYWSRLATFHFRAGDQLLLVSLFNESAQFAPLERSLREFGLVQLNADASYFDAARTESILRRFDVRGVAGINTDVLDGLVALGHDPLALFANRVVWAHPTAHARLRAAPGITLRLWLEVGPAVAMQCAHGEGAHIDRLEWKVASDGDEVMLSNRLPRALHFADYATGVRARVEYAACGCGSADPRLIPL